MGKGSINTNRSYLRRVAGAAAHKANSLYTLSKSYTPASIIKIEERAEQSLKDLLDERAHLVEKGDSVITNLDERLDSVVESMEGLVTDSHTKVERVSEMISPLVNSVAFVTSNVGKSFIHGNEQESTDADLALCERFSHAISSLNDHYVKALKTADDRIELWLPSKDQATDDSLTASNVTGKTIRKLKAAAFDKLDSAKLRTETQINDLVTVDLIQYASESLDGVCTLAVQAKQQAKDKVNQKVVDSQDFVRSKVSEIEAKMTETKELVLATAAAGRTKAQSQIQQSKTQAVLQVESVYGLIEGRWTLVRESDKYVACNAMVKMAIARIQGLHNSTVASVAFTQGKIALLFQDGAVALVDNLRTEGVLPPVGTLTVANMCAQSRKLAVSLVQLAKDSPALAQAQSEKLYLDLMEVAKTAPADTKAKLAVVLALGKTQAEQVRAFWVETADKMPEQLEQMQQLVQDQAAEFVSLVQSAPAQAEVLAEQLYMLLLDMKQQATSSLLAQTSVIAGRITEARAQVEGFKAHLVSVVAQSMLLAQQSLILRASQATNRATRVADKTVDAVAPRLVGAIKAAPYGEQSLELAAKGLKKSPVWQWLPTKIANMLLPDVESVKMEPVVEQDPVSLSALDSEAQQEALYQAGEEMFAVCDKNLDDVVTKTEIKNFSRTDDGKPLRELLEAATSGWADFWKLIDPSKDGTFSKDAFATAFAQLAYSYSSTQK